MENIKNIMNAIKSDFITEEGVIYTEDNQTFSSKEAFNILIAELERLQEFEWQINEKNILTAHAIELAIKEEGRYCTVRFTEENSDGIIVVLWEDFHDFSQGTITYEYSWEKLKKSYNPN